MGCNSGASSAGVELAGSNSEQLKFFFDAGVTQRLRSVVVHLLHERSVGVPRHGQPSYQKILIPRNGFRIVGSSGAIANR